MTKRMKLIIAALLSLALTTLIDYITGYELEFSAAYLVPVALCGWSLGKTPVWYMSIASGAITWWMDFIEGRPYSHMMFQYWNSFTCFLISLVTGLSLYRVRNSLEERNRANSHLQSALSDLEASTAEIRKLQSGLQVICAWTKQVKVGDKWMNPEEFLTNHLHLHLTHGISPEASLGFEKELEKLRA